MSHNIKTIADMNLYFLHPYLNFMRDYYGVTWYQISNTYTRSTLHQRLAEVERRYVNYRNFDLCDNKVKVVIEHLYIYCDHSAKYYPLVPHLMLYKIARKILALYDIMLPSIDELLGEGIEVVFTLNNSFNINMIRDELDKLVISPQPQI